MIIPVRCFTCGSLTSDKWVALYQKQQSVKTSQMKKLNLIWILNT